MFMLKKYEIEIIKRVVTPWHYYQNCKYCQRSNDVFVLQIGQFPEITQVPCDHCSNKMLITNLGVK